MDYEQSVAYILDAPLFGAHKNGLINIRALLDRLGNPQDRLRIIHVAGTNGKGSTCAYLDSILRQAGYRTGLYTSPYLERFTERFRLNGQEIAEADFARLATRVRAAAEAMTAGGLTHPTFFELITAVCFLYFEEAAVDAAVIETGMGGRLDATNVVRPMISVITAIGRDHVKVLGDTLADIAREKAGIMKPHTPVVIYPQESAEAWAELLAAARQEGAPLYAVSDCHIVTRNSGIDGQTFSLEYQGMRFPDLRIGLLGRYQVLNAATALVAVLVLAQRGDFPLTEDHVRKGLERTLWPGRLEVMSRNPFVILDGAHNPQGAEQLRRALEDLFPGQRMVMVCGILKTKEAGPMALHFSSIASEVILTRPDPNKSTPCEKLMPLFESGGLSLSMEDDPIRALEQGLERARKTGQPLVIAGSLYLAGAARTWWRTRPSD